MTTLKIKINQSHDFTALFKEANKVVRIAFNLFKKDLNLTQVQLEIKKYTINPILDVSLIRFSCQEAETLYKSFKEKDSDTMIFGSKQKWIEFNAGKISKEEFNEHKNNNPILFLGSKADVVGNRKVALDIDNKQIILKLSRYNHFPINIQTSKKRLRLLKQLQTLAKNHVMPLTYKLCKDFIYVIYDEKYLADRHTFVKDRIASLDLNPNYIALTIKDFSDDNFSDDNIILKQVFDLSKVNLLTNNDKIKHEVIQISHSIAQSIKHYQCELVGLEDLNMKSKNHNKGKYLNRLINNKWKRNLFVNNLKKRLNILGIKNQEINAAYSSTVGCLEHPDETDSIAAALEIGRRAYVFKKKFLDKHSDFLDMDIMFPIMDRNLIKERRNSILSDYNPKNIGYKGIHEYLKQQKKLTQLRFLFKDYNFSDWSCYRFKSIKSCVATNLYV